MSATLLIEIGVEELPPKAMRALADAFAEGVVAGLDACGLDHGAMTRYATPRRLALSIARTAALTPARQVEKAGPAVAIAFDGNGVPTPAALGFARSCGVPVDALAEADSDKGPRLMYRGEEPGQPLEALLPGIVDKVLRQLPIPKRMRWGDSDAAFVRPVHWVVAMHGRQVLALSVFGIDAGNETFGHRFHHPEAIALEAADDYVAGLLSPGYVLADPDARKSTLLEQVADEAKRLDGLALVDDALAEEVTALVEWPVAISGRFDAEFLTLPREVLIATLEGHQRYFPVENAEGALVNGFVTVANLQSRDVDQVIAGNERVIRPRLADALFFWKQDCRLGLAAYAEGLDRVSFQRALGSLADKTKRVSDLAEWLAAQAPDDDRLTDAAIEQAAKLCKADLLTEMVGEFPELQGIMGLYYALDAGLQPAVAKAIAEHYAPQSAGAPIAVSPAGRLLAVADRLDTLAGIFSIGKRPTGDKDPFALRRAALGVLRTLIEGGLSIDLKAAVGKAVLLQPVATEFDVGQVLLDFHLERLRGYYVDQGYTPEAFEAVAATGVTDMLDFDRRIAAVGLFVELPAAAVVCGAHKRARNLLKTNDAHRRPVDSSLLTDANEQRLATALSRQEQAFEQALAGHDYSTALSSLAELAEPLDAFFDHVMVMTDDEALRHNRLALLAALDARCRQVADISCLSAAGMGEPA